MQVTLDDLSDAESLALGGLLRLMIRIDGSFSQAEEEVLGELAEELSRQGSDGATYRGQAVVQADPQAIYTIIDRAGRALENDDAIREAARAVTRPEAREIIYGALFAVATADTISTGEGALLTWLEETWELAVETVDDDDDA
jgi:hypothetical protein